MQLNERIILNKDIEIFDPETPANGDINDYGDKEPFSYLRYRHRHRVFTITPLMKEMLEYCRSPLTVQELVEWVSENQGCSEELVYPVVTRFLKRMVKLDIIVPGENQKKREQLTILNEIMDSKKFGNFILLEELGRNSKTILYKCFSSKEERQTVYTLKILTDESSRRESLRKSFEREVRISKDLPPHENIRTCISASAYYNIPYMVLEYIDGESLPGITDKISLNTKYEIARQLMSAIGHLHRHGILHGDIHASNFLIDSDDVVHLIDLGMAYYEHEKKVRHGGVPRYMPPERMPEHSYQFSKCQGDYVAEVFQTGVCLYLLFSGEYPFHGKLLTDLRHSIKNSTPPPLNSTCMGEPIPEKVSKIIFKSLEKNPASRYQSVSEMLQEWKIAIKQRTIKQPV